MQNTAPPSGLSSTQILPLFCITAVLAIASPIPLHLIPLSTPRTNLSNIFCFDSSETPSPWSFMHIFHFLLWSVIPISTTVPGGLYFIALSRTLINACLRNCVTLTLYSYPQLRRVGYSSFNCRSCNYRGIR